MMKMARPLCEESKMSGDQTGFPDFIAPPGLTPLTAEPHARSVSAAPVNTTPANTAPVDTATADAASAVSGVTAVASTPDIPNTSGRQSWRTIFAIGLVIVALVAVGLAVWLGGRQILNREPICKPIDSAKYTADDGWVPSLPMALLEDQATPTRVEVVGVWCDVVLIDLEYQQTENLNGDHSYAYFNTDVLRAVDVSTGSILWTLDKSPDGSPLMFNSAVSENGKLALATMRDGGFTQPGDSELCINGTDLQILNLRTGRVLTRTFVDGRCTPASSTDDTMSTVASAVAYQAGIVVVELSTGNVPMLMTGGTVSTSAYQDTNLATPLWTVGSSSANSYDPIIRDRWTDRTLPGGWVRTGTGTYVRIVTGDSSHVIGDGQARRFFAAGDMTLGAYTSATSGSGYSSLAGWSDLTASAPDWTYSPPTGWVIAQNEYLMREFPYPKSLTPVVAVTEGAIIVMEQRMDSSGVTEANLTAIGDSDGKALWSTPYEFTLSDLATVYSMSGNNGNTSTDGGFSLLARANATVIDLDGSELLVYNEPGSVVLADAKTGQIIASQTMNARTTSGIYRCSDASVCVAVDFVGSLGFPAKTGMMKMSVSASSLGTPAETDLMLATSGYATSNVGYDGVYPTEAGLFGVARQGADYRLVLI